ncbi:MAG: tetratricopeptide repeat protein [Deltaproteobacteria bacterium]|nr:tetratricopeptide repeat protein [Deltaproteobacteria bacterium]
MIWRGLALVAVLMLAGELITPAQDLNQAAQEAIRNHRFARAREIYQVLHKRQPANLEYLMWIARLSGWLGEYQQAIEDYDGILNREPGNVDALIGKAYVLMWQGQLSAARVVLQRARAIAPNDSDFADAWQAYTRYSQAPEPAHHFVSNDEQSAIAAIKSNHLARAQELYRKLTVQDPSDLEYQLSYARVTGWLGDYRGSVRIFDRVLANHPDNLEALIGKAEVLMWQGRYDEAATLLNQARTAAPNNIEIELALARFYFYQADSRDAHKYVEQVLQQDSHNTDALELQTKIASNYPWLLQLGFDENRFSYTGPGEIGRTTIGYQSRNTDFYLNHEVWHWYGKVQNRFGGSIVQRLPTHTWLHAGFLYGPGGVTVIPREDFDLGVSQQLAYGLVPSLDYRYLHFSGSNVHFIEPGIEYYFNRPIWLRLEYIQTLTNYTHPSGPGGIVPMESVMARYNQQIAEPFTIHAGYAFGGETFLPYTYDRVGQFTANTGLAGADWSLSRLFQVGAWYSCEVRSDNRTISSVALTFTFRR